VESVWANVTEQIKRRQQLKSNIVFKDLSMFSQNNQFSNMYNLPYFKETDSEKIRQFMHQHPFAMLIGSAGNMPVATQVPLLIEEKSGRLFLKGHIMRNTDHHKALEQNGNVLCVFTGAQAYVSASWYQDPHVGSTWNYMSVHAKGMLRFVDEASLIEILRQTTAHFENNPHSPSLFHHLPDAYVQRLVKAIAGFEIEVRASENVFKLSQNGDEESYQNIIRQLQKGDRQAQEIATEMERRSSQLFDAT
jgi:transcriptional regulator